MAYTPMRLVNRFWIETEFWGDKVQFWPYDKEGEIDLIINFNEAIIGVLSMISFPC